MQEDHRHERGRFDGAARGAELLHRRTRGVPLRGQLRHMGPGHGVGGRESGGLCAKGEPRREGARNLRGAARQPGVHVLCESRAQGQARDGVLRGRRDADLPQHQNGHALEGGRGGGHVVRALPYHSQAAHLQCSHAGASGRAHAPTDATEGHRGAWVGGTEEVLPRPRVWRRGGRQPLTRSLPRAYHAVGGPAQLLRPRAPSSQRGPPAHPLLPA
mmetsp:Transcript_12697/g.26663  ORF Transcript_12697/g.26663 Transcript_12697/m.26663 type:complete len:216 (+) Transcript_12697:1704-2351(+)